ncbi:MAG: hypothetical protein F4085_07640 [Acidimicrobiia bacterium]|nr:hypothetical protein [Acidimicrobiia bacterium]
METHTTTVMKNNSMFRDPPATLRVPALAARSAAHEKEKMLRVISTPLNTAKTNPTQEESDVQSNPVCLLACARTTKARPTRLRTMSSTSDGVIFL